MFYLIHFDYMISSYSSLHASVQSQTPLSLADTSASTLIERRPLHSLQHSAEVQMRIAMSAAPIIGRNADTTYNISVLRSTSPMPISEVFLLLVNRKRSFTFFNAAVPYLPFRLYCYVCSTSGCEALGHLLKEVLGRR